MSPTARPVIAIWLLFAVALGACRGEVGGGTPAPPLSVAAVTPSANPSPSPTRIRPTARATPAPPTATPGPALPPLPPPHGYAEAITAFLNADPVNALWLTDVLLGWDRQENRSAYTQPIAEQIIRSVDLSGDAEPELVIASPGSYSGELIVIFKHQEGRYLSNSFLMDTTMSAEVFRIIEIDDINGDQRPEIIMRGIMQGAHSAFLTFNVINWHDQVFDQLLDVYMPNAELRIEDRIGDKTPEIVVEGGIIYSVGAGMQRLRTKIYQWDDRSYRHIDTILDPVASQHPYWQMMDGLDALRAGDEQRAGDYFGAVLAAPLPYEFIEVPDEQIQDVARFQLVFLAARRGDLTEARRIAGEADPRHKQFVAWSTAFFTAYERQGDLDAACAAARQAAGDTKMTGSGYLNNPMWLNNVLCVPDPLIAVHKVLELSVSAGSVKLA